MSAYSIKPVLQNAIVRQDFIRDCVSVIEAQVESQRGFSGIVFKNSYSMLGKLVPQATWQATDFLIDEFAEQMEPFLQEFSDRNEGDHLLPVFLSQKADRIAEALLKVTDTKAKTFDSSAILSLYKSLRPHAKKQVERAVPDIAQILQKYLTKAPQKLTGTEQNS